MKLGLWWEEEGDREQKRERSTYEMIRAQTDGSNRNTEDSWYM